MKVLKIATLTLLALTLPWSILPAFAEVNSGYDEGFYIKDDGDKFRLKINMVIQPQYQFVAIQESEDISTFQIRRMRFQFAGHLFTKKMTYRLKFEALSGFGTISNENDGSTTAYGLKEPTVMDAYINYEFMPELAIRVGQFILPYNREMFSSSEKMQLVDRSFVHDVFTLSRDIGLMIHGKLADKKVEYSLYVANEGSSQNRVNPNSEMVFGARVAYNILGAYGLQAGDHQNSKNHNLTVGVPGMANRTSKSLDDELFGVVGDLAYRYRGYSFITEIHQVWNRTENVQVFGALGQTGYFIIPTKLELAARIAYVRPSVDFQPSDITVSDGYEFTGGLNYLFYGHNIKLQADYAYLKNSPFVINSRGGPSRFIITGNPYLGFTEDQTDHRIRVQLQLAF